MSFTPPQQQAWRSALEEGAAVLGLALRRDQLEAHAIHLALVVAHGGRAGLTAIADPVEIAVKHFLDSLTCLLGCEIAAGERVADIGPGGGFPGLVLAAARPGAAYTLIEANRKRAQFLREVVVAMGLRDVVVFAERAEAVARRPEHREGYGLVVSRAVAPLPTLLEYCLPLVKIGGCFVAMKGPAAEAEIAASSSALAALGGRLAGRRSLSLPRGMGKRLLVTMEKAAPTPERYPRRSGIAARRPL